MVAEGGCVVNPFEDIDEDYKTNLEDYSVWKAWELVKQRLYQSFNDHDTLYEVEELIDSVEARL